MPPGLDHITSAEVAVPVREGAINATLDLPPDARGLVIFAHGSGSSRFSPRNRNVAASLQAAGFGTILVDLLTPEEAQLNHATAEYRFDIARLARRLVQVTEWAKSDERLHRLAQGYFGASTGAAAALVAAAERPLDVAAVVSRGGRPDLAGEALRRVRAPTLLIVGARDVDVLELNWLAQQQMYPPAHLEIVANATHLFEEPGALDTVIRLAGAWFEKHLVGPERVRSAGGRW
jgi:pimeloyl-ACP methyl ester carboxylesterase